MILIPALEQLGITEDVWAQVTEKAKHRQIDDEVLLDVQHRASEQGRWDVVYAISYLAGLETSVLIDAEGVISIDWGTSGQVQLSPPVGCIAPFRLWVHTHPGFTAYWSGTDTRSLSIGLGIVEKAMVLGAPGVKCAHNATMLPLSEKTQRISMTGPLNEWSDEEVIQWADWYNDHLNLPEVVL
tara:strand:- start:5562 stop:6113 length:552 start_codon:yes stop_codon:yes gene_type:complete